jgi:hypothetical protein
MRLREKGLLEKFNIAQHAYEEGPRVVWDKARILEIESNYRHRECTESAHMTCLKTPISQPSSISLPSGSPLSSMS